MINPNDWELAKADIIDMMSTPTDSITQSKDISDFIASKYFEVIAEAETILTKQKLINNAGLVEIGKTGLSSAFQSFFASSKTILVTPEEATPIMTANYATLSANITSVLSSFWIASLMNSMYNGFIPGHVSFIPPCKVLGGAFILVYDNMPAHNNVVKFVSKFIDACKTHLLTVSGLHAGIVPPSPAPPYPLPWVGLN